MSIDSYVKTYVNELMRRQTHDIWRYLRQQDGDKHKRLVTALEQANQINLRLLAALSAMRGMQIDINNIHQQIHQIK